MEDRETPRMHKYGESKTTRIMMANVRHVNAWEGRTKYQAAWFLLNRVYKHQCRNTSLTFTSMLLVLFLYMELVVSETGWISERKNFYHSHTNISENVCSHGMCELLKKKIFFLLPCANIIEELLFLTFVHASQYIHIAINMYETVEMSFPFYSLI